MNTDTIQHLRDMLDDAEIVTPVHYWKAKGEIVGANGNGLLGCDIAEAPAVVAALNALPALLDIAEAAHEMRKVQRQCSYDAAICADGRTYSAMTRISLEQDCDCALALLSHTKPEGQETK